MSGGWKRVRDNEFVGDGDFVADGIMVRTSATNYTTRTIMGTASEVEVTNGDGVAGNPTIGLPATVDLSTSNLVLPYSDTFSPSATGMIGVDTTIANHQGLLKYHSSDQSMVVIAMPVANLIANDNYVVGYDAASDSFEMIAGGAGGGADYLNDLLDVVISSATTGQVLTYSGTSWVNSASAGGASALDDLTDVVITGVATGELVKFDGTNWINNTLAEAGITSVPTYAGKLNYPNLLNVGGTATWQTAENVMIYENDFLYYSTATFNKGWSILNRGGSTGLFPVDSTAFSKGLCKLGVTAVTTPDSVNLTLGPTNVPNCLDISDATTVISEVLFKVGTLSDGTENQIIWFGMHDAQAYQSITTDGAYFIYDYGTYSNHKWHGACKAGGTATVSSATATVTSGTWTYLRIENTIGTNVKFFINNYTTTADITISTNMPGSGNLLNPWTVLFRKSAGTGSARTLDVDWARCTIITPARF